MAVRAAKQLNAARKVMKIVKPTKVGGTSLAKASAAKRPGHTKKVLPVKSQKAEATVGRCARSKIDIATEVSLVPASKKKAKSQQRDKTDAMGTLCNIEQSDLQMLCREVRAAMEAREAEKMRNDAALAAAVAVERTRAEAAVAAERLRATAAVEAERRSRGNEAGSRGNEGGEAAAALRAWKQASDIFTPEKIADACMSAVEAIMAKSGLVLQQFPPSPRSPRPPASPIPLQDVERPPLEFRGARVAPLDAGTAQGHVNFDVSDSLAEQDTELGVVGAKASSTAATSSGRKRVGGRSSGNAFMPSAGVPVDANKSGRKRVLLRSTSCETVTPEPLGGVHTREAESPCKAPRAKRASPSPAPAAEKSKLQDGPKPGYRTIIRNPPGSPHTGGLEVELVEWLPHAERWRCRVVRSW